ncbi:metallophosphoesterase [Marinilactibacillus sp. Marseille-P9653]|uniref:metallophosphoesterase n=1 Tax=Marinilactibacillus sp. Marseille-P9653 TaxID=2866583 RepID=UPI001CE40859|nr:metallophosphoesterase [Marinilactibacillus sp. Marseille-P9653]
MEWLLILIALVFGLIVYLYLQNYYLDIDEYTVTIPKLHNNIKGKKIVQISDTHLKQRYNNGYIDQLLQKIKAQDPDIIVIVGDLVQASLPDLVDVPIRKLCEGLSAVAPTYMVTGNHDIQTPNFEDLTHVLNSSKVRLLLDEAEWVDFGEEEGGIVLMGLAERPKDEEIPKPILKYIELTAEMSRQPKILLAHRPERFKEYLDDKTKAPSLTLSGHTHAGQMRIPFIGGAIAPGQGLFPKYDYGIFSDEEDQSKRMIISRGIGNSSFPFRINNRPEIVVITLN